MALIDEVANRWNALCRQEPGWRAILAAHGITPADESPQALKQALETDLGPEQIQRQMKGFEDFAREGRKGIEPGAPALSLLYHALASPGVLADPQGRPLRMFPSAEDIEVVENYVFAAARRSLRDVLRWAAISGRPGETEGTEAVRKVALVVFAHEYRPASQTCHKLHADKVYSRTGIARVGTAPPLYDARRRGYLPEAEGDPYAIRVCPARYAAYLAVLKVGDRAAYRPLRFQGDPRSFGNVKPVPDDQRQFWVPVHKLFDGDECLSDVPGLQVRFKTVHLNEKIYRLHHLALAVSQVPQTPPYWISEGIAELQGSLLVPTPHSRLIEPALVNGSPVTYPVTAGTAGRYSSYASPPQQQGNLPYPQYVHARTLIARHGQHFVEINLNNDADHPDVRERVNQGGYEALHYVDYSGDGWVMAHCPQLQKKSSIEPTVHPAYSLVTAPDFFPSCDQRELTEWTSSNAVPEHLVASIWSVEPDSLCDQRLPANLQFPGSLLQKVLPKGFTPDAREEGVTALVPLLWPASRLRTEPPPADALRHSHLPDDAAGVFDPGWDVSWDLLPALDAVGATPHLAAYGLGSPFPEDMKLCAALGSYWPAVAPDSARTTEPNPHPSKSRTVIPLTDQEIGSLGNLPWDGVHGPRVQNIEGQEIVEYASFQHVDYVRTALEGRFTLRLTARVGPQEYQARVLAMAFVYEVLGGRPLDWIVLSFRAVLHGDPELEEAQVDAQTVLPGDVFRFEVFERIKSTPSPHDFRRQRLPVTNKHYFFVDPANNRVLRRPAGQLRWRRAELP